MKQIAVIGAGVTGLTTAYELSKLGYSVTIFEKGNSIGGLAGGFKISNSPLEKAYHHIFKTDKDIINLFEELGIIDELSWFESRVAMVTNEEGNYLIRPFNGAVDLLRYKPLSILSRLRAGITTFFLGKYKNWRKLISVPAIEWIKKWSGVEVGQKLWGPLLMGKFSKYADQISMAWLWARIHVRANSRDSIFSKELLGYPKGSFAIVSETLLDKTVTNLNKKHEDVLKLNISITKITTGDNKNVKLIFEDDSGTEFDAVVGAIPTGIFAQLLPKGTILSDVKYIGAIVMSFSSSQSLSEFYWHNIMDPDAPFLAFIQHTNLVPKKFYNGDNIYYIGAYVPHDHEYFQMSEKEIEEKWFTYLRSVFHDFNKNEIKEKHLFRFKNAQHIVDTDYEAKIAPFRLDFKGAYLSNFSQIFPEDRGINYAARDGKKVAQMVHDDLKGK